MNKSFKNFECNNVNLVFTILCEVTQRNFRDILNKLPKSLIKSESENLGLLFHLFTSGQVGDYCSVKSKKIIIYGALFIVNSLPIL